ncbi:MAG: toll/interleukin-1 receptor domain-containing protein [Desulfobacterales bacterium]|nr:toll/interleukin-1 receptor domain-containing protein [Desulfobacterales bacterium]
MRKVFISYSRKNEDFVKELYHRLSNEDVACFFDKESTTWNTNQVVALENGLDECEVIILVLSPDFCRTEWPRIESTSVLVNDPASFSRKLQLLLLKPCEKYLSGFLRECQPIDVSADDKFEAAYTRICRDLVGTFTKKDPAVDQDNLFESVCSAVVQEMARVTDDSDIYAYGQLEKILPHAELLLSFHAIKTEQAINLRNYLCMHYWKQGKLAEAEKHGRKAVAISEGHFEPGHPRIATSQSNLGEVLRSIGELEEARDLLRKALESDEKSFKPGHPVIAIRQSVLALVLLELGELEEARDLLGKALESDEKTFGPGHPKIATRQLNLAAVLLDLGEFGEARDLAEQAYRSFLGNFGPGHPHTKTAKVNLAFF